MLPDGGQPHQPEGGCLQQTVVRRVDRVLVVATGERSGDRRTHLSADVDAASEGCERLLDFDVVTTHTSDEGVFEEPRIERGECRREFAERAPPDELGPEIEWYMGRFEQVEDVLQCDLGSDEEVEPRRGNHADLRAGLHAETTCFGGGLHLDRTGPQCK